jgi:hypothetical protein
MTVFLKARLVACLVLSNLKPVTSYPSWHGYKPKSIMAIIPVEMKKGAQQPLPWQIVLLQRLVI